MQRRDAPSSPPASDFAHHVGVQRTRAFVRKFVGLGAARTLVRDDAEHLRNDVAGALDRAPCRRCARPSRAISSSLCSVAFCTTTPPTVTGSSLATGVSAPVRPTWISMSLTTVRGLLGGEFVRDRPARRARDEAEPFLPVEPVDLVDDAVDVVVERARAAPRCRDGMRSSLLDRTAQLGQRIGREAAALEPLRSCRICVSAGISLISPQA